MLYKLTKIKAGALQYVLVVSVIIAVIMFAFMLLINLQRQISTKHTFYKQAIYSVNYGFDYLSNSYVEYNKKLSREFSDNPKEETTVLRKKWGLFDLGMVKSKVGKEFFQKTGLLGWKQKDRKALYLQDNNNPLVLVGKSIIIGDVSLPEQGVKTGNIGGISFYGDNLVIGKKYISISKLPSIENVEILNEVMNQSYLNDSIQRFELENNLNMMQSFNKQTLLNDSGFGIFLRNITLKGNIIIRSEKKIIVEASAKLNDVILIAPEIELKENVYGNFQVFATKSIILGKNCKIEYPSALVLIDDKEDKKNGNKIEIGEGSVFKGILLYKDQSKQGKRSYIPQIIVKDKALLVGETYSEGNVELLGSINGTVIAKGFIANQFGNTYLNHIYNGRINERELYSEYVGLKINSDYQKVVKWLY
ncbi:hypothetical protein [Tenacibaculum caenipelagi]|uniref:Cytoskeletal protein CcmA (Bactofilin family) n=1 Tax=Tenacibaculum caenipelagi TaxID=1325435 RepID=A0A4R6TDA9_9FLAO|nr:hypothetical protein [Tenacibaculum caenipelagi]TDQ21838.1 hypothetical protein DFQ07_2933 [Tenacibaculum caenipelagi]